MKLFKSALLSMMVICPSLAFAEPSLECEIKAKDVSEVVEGGLIVGHGKHLVVSDHKMVHQGVEFTFNAWFTLTGTTLWSSTVSIEADGYEAESDYHVSMKHPFVVGDAVSFHCEADQSI